MPSHLELWLTALKSPNGICIETNDRQLLRQQLYRIRSEAKNALLDGLTIVLVREETELWIIHKDPNVPPS